MDLQQQLIDFRAWALNFDGVAQKWMWSAIALLLAYFLGVIVSWLLRFFALKLIGLAKHRKGEEEKSADHLLIDMLSALVRVLFVLIAAAVAANLLTGYSLDHAEELA